jgi:hypothetical protein
MTALAECESLQSSGAVAIENPLIPYLSSPCTSSEDGNDGMNSTALQTENFSKSTSVNEERASVRKGSHKHRECDFCHATQTPMWRRGPGGKGTLCNACGVKWSLRRRSTPKRVISLQSTVCVFFTN